MGPAGRAALAAGITGIGGALLALDVPAWNTLWFLFAWTGWLLAVDATIDVIQGHSFVHGRRRELGAMLVWSVPYWCLFEGYNLVLDNWTYVFLPRSEWAQAAFATLAFATVLPACFFHAELLKALGLAERVRWRPLRVTPVIEVSVALFGLACAVLPLVAPRWAFPLVWGATLGIPEVINRRVGAPSLLADLEQGRPARFLRLLAGGLIAGGVWEGLNFFARAKWVYTVPGFEEWKLFEMPLLGFLGFPVLAVEAFSGYALLCFFVRGGRHWELPDADQRERRIPSGHHARAMLILVAFSWFAELYPLDPAVLARRPLLDELDELREEDRMALARHGLSTPERLARAVARDGLSTTASVTGVDAARLGPASTQAALALHKGMGTVMAGMLLALGYETAADLAVADPEQLHAALTRRAHEQGHRPPTLAQVKVWLRAARLTGEIRR